MTCDELIEALANAVKAERDLRRQWEQLLVECRRQGIHFSRLARHTFRARTGRWPDADERKKEDDRLRQAYGRVTARHGKSTTELASVSDAAVESISGGDNLMRLRRRQIVEKTVTEDYSEECAEPEAAEDDDEEAEREVDPDEVDEVDTEDGDAADDEDTDDAA